MSRRQWMRRWRHEIIVRLINRGEIFENTLVEIGLNGHVIRYIYGYEYLYWKCPFDVCFFYTINPTYPRSLNEIDVVVVMTIDNDTKHVNTRIFQQKRNLTERIHQTVLTSGTLAVPNIPLRTNIHLEIIMSSDISSMTLAASPATRANSTGAR